MGSLRARSPDSETSRRGEAGGAADAALRALFPGDVRVACATATARIPPLLPAERPFVERAVPSRRREFALGRACARRALAGLGLPPLPLLPGPDRAPRWPAGIVGSITHCPDFCAAVVARRGRVLGIGVDAEPVTPLDRALLPLVCTDSERARLGAPPDRDEAKLLFSAKESAFKCYYPLTGAMLDFEDLEVELARDAGGFRARLTRSDLPAAAGARILHGRFLRAGGLWLTGVVLEAAAAPGRGESGSREDGCRP